MSYGNSIVNFGIIPEEIIQTILDEANRAHNLHGTSSMLWADNHRALAILSEEVGEVAHEMNEVVLGNITYDMYLVNIRKELVQVAAMATTWIRKIDIDSGNS